MECDIPQELNLGFLKLCFELQLFLNKTESCLHLTKENFKQVEYIWKPWNAPKDYHLRKCSCSTLQSTELPESSEHADLLDNVTKTLKHAESMRKISSKGDSIKSNIKNFKKSDTTVATASTTNKNSVAVKKSISNKTSISNISAHMPSCPLFNLSQELSKKESLLSLSDVLSYYKIPPILKRVYKHSYQIMNADKFEQKSKLDYKAIFLQRLQCQTEHTCSLLKEESIVNMLFTCLSALHVYEKKRQCRDNSNSWIFYKDWNYLKKYMFSQNDIAIRESWTVILNYILKELIPLLQKCELSHKQKLYLFKIVKTIINFVNSTVPSVPIFRCE